VHPTPAPPTTPRPTTCGACAGRTSRHGRPTLGPCALPAHDGTVHQDADGVIWAELAKFTVIDRCCVCRSTAVTYRNHRGQPFCAPCAEGDRTHGPDTPPDDRDQQIQELQAEIAHLRAQLGHPQEAP
jgi:hypothetical protein